MASCAADRAADPAPTPSPASEDSPRRGDALAAILYTGGATGRSNGVMLSHANFWTAAVTRGAELNTLPESVWLLVAPLFRAGLGAEIRIADESGRELPAGKVGEVQARGPCSPRATGASPRSRGRLSSTAGSVPATAAA